MTQALGSDFRVSLACTSQDLLAAQRLRYDVFVTELGGDGPLVDHDARLEKDHLDPFFDHLLLWDMRTDQVVGVYRLMRQSAADRAGGFYSASEYDLSVLLSSGRRLLELGRSCVHRDFRGGLALRYLWSGLAQYVADHRIDILFGVASFHGTDAAALAGPLSLLHHRHLAPEHLRVKAHAAAFQRMDLVSEADLDRRAAMIGVPGLIKAYLRAGGCVGEGAYVDRAFNTTDVCLILDTAKLQHGMARQFEPPKT